MINRIHFRNLRGDISGGVINAIVSLMIALTFGVVSGLGVVVVDRVEIGLQIG
ncbi:hypothetical protein WKK05_11645 [Nostoc sp. UHCC 0302]|uniref:hypothetical protein n=1 Tax=Nostoc sp. UHCC 0302 TaxID=3134896 RepID=UPI00311C94D3